MSRRIAFDTSVFIAHFEQQREHDLGAIQGIVDDVDSGRALLLVPTVVVAELFFKQCNVDAIEAFLRSPSVLVCELTEKAAKLAGRIRSTCNVELGFKPRMPDTLIAATAQSFDAEVLYTTDGPLKTIASCSILTTDVRGPDGPRSLFTGSEP